MFEITKDGGPMAAVMRADEAQIVNLDTARIKAEANAAAQARVESSQKDYAAIKHFISRFLSAVDTELLDGVEDAVLRGSRINLVEVTLEQVSRDLHSDSCDGCRHIMFISDGGSAEDAEDCTSAYRLAGGGHLLADFCLPQYCDDECDAYLNGLTYFPPDDAEGFRSAVEDCATAVASKLLSSLSYIASSVSNVTGGDASGFNGKLADLFKNAIKGA